MKPNGLQININDDVAVALEDIPAGAGLHLANGVSLTALDDIPFGHKVLLRDLPAGAEVHKYGEVIGALKAPLQAGHWLHDQHFTAGETP